MPRCLCGKYFADAVLRRHQLKCNAILERSRNSFHAGEANKEKFKRRRLEEQQRASGMNNSGSSAGVDSISDSGVDDTSIVVEDIEATVSDLPRTTRSGRTTKKTWKLRDQLPEPSTGLSEEVMDTGSEATLGSAPPMPSSDTAVDLATEQTSASRGNSTISTLPDSFGLSRKYVFLPSHVPDEQGSVDQRFLPNLASIASEASARSIKEIINPYPNLSSWAFAYHHWTSSNSKSLDEREKMQNLITSEHFNAQDIKGIDFKRLDKQLDETPLPWQDPRNGWVESSIPITIPSGVKSTQATRRADTAAHRNVERSEVTGDLPAEDTLQGIHFEVPGFWHRSITAVIRSVFGHDKESERFHLHPFERVLTHSGPDGESDIERVYDELYTSQAWLDADAALQQSPPEPDCDRHRAVAALMFASDSTHLAQFGQAKLWPAYLYFGNQSKYIRCQPQARPAHRVAYIPSMSDTVHDVLRDSRGGKIASGSLAPLLAHCRREFVQGAWKVLLDDEFLAAYEHGMVVKCVDGIERRIYPRIFVYSADYPEKVLIATLRDMGQCPCPRCLVTKDKLADVGTKEDRAMRTISARTDDNTRRIKVKEARKLMYGDGYVVNSERVEDLLKSQSLVPTENAFSNALQSSQFDFFSLLAVDLMHEVELGVWKVTFAHLIRILEAHDSNAINELNRRFRQLPTFGRSTIRKFSVDVAAMKKMAARDFEDILQCCIPCFEGLLPSPHNEIVLDLLYVMAEWHGLAKLQMHSDLSLHHLDVLTTSLGVHIRRFQRIACAAFDTRETERECEARGRAAARRSAGQAQTASVPAMPSGRRRCTLNLWRYKVHALGDYVHAIRIFGTTDSYTTQTPELEHRRVKQRYDQTNKNVSMPGQIVRLDIRSVEMRRMAQELHALGIKLPDDVIASLRSECEDTTNPRSHFMIAKDQHYRNATYISQWLADHPDDPAMVDFEDRLFAHLHPRIRERFALGEDHDFPFYFKDDRIYRHATARFNFMTYDVRRDQDTINPRTDKSTILVALHPDDCHLTSHLLAYARVLGIFHAQVEGDFPVADKVSTRFDFLWVRWYHHIPNIVAGSSTRHLDCLQYVAGNSEDAVGFLDLAQVIRGVHLIPGYHDGRTSDFLGPSCAREPEGNYRYYYVNRFIDRDMLMRFIGLGIGHIAGVRCERSFYEYVDEPEGSSSIPSTTVQAPVDSDSIQETDEDTLDIEEEVEYDIPEDLDGEGEDIDDDLALCDEYGDL